jgi:4-carboxymuconolactone decarboxylase
LDEKTRWLLKAAISASCSNKRALETHLKKDQEADVTDQEIKYALLLLMQTAGLPTFMRAYTVFRSML